MLTGFCQVSRNFEPQTTLSDQQRIDHHCYCAATNVDLLFLAVPCQAEQARSLLSLSGSSALCQTLFQNLLCLQLQALKQGRRIHTAMLPAILLFWMLHVMTINAGGVPPSSPAGSYQSFRPVSSQCTIICYSELTIVCTSSARSTTADLMFAIFTKVGKMHSCWCRARSGQQGLS